MADSPQIGVFLKDSPADGSALAFANMIGRIRGTAKMHFVHYREDGPGDPHPDPDPSEFEATVRGASPDIPDERMICTILPQRGARAILKSIRDNNLDLAIIGRRLPTDQLAAGHTVSRVAAKAPCSVLVITEYSQPHFGRFLIPTDFSDASAAAVALALDIVRAADLKDPQIILQHNVEAGYGHQYTGATFEEYVESLEKNAARNMGEFLARLNVGGLKLQTIITSSSRPDEAIIALAVAHKVDMVMVGSRGRTSPWDVLLGSTAERIAMHCPLPVLIVKKKGETLDLLKAIMKE